ncbi:Hypothetical_protein [Hexamita inflata]|uniref:Hypothetical_protein n=1 Tax=Hexamita inflata TaxID=28002 RepID=A0AA86R9X3_9EUKA|nr:Hypothetical protein HINF_LOCUS57716 [Hexamita inflata]
MICQLFIYSFTLLQDKCPSDEVHLPGASRCSHCPQNTVPNVGQDGCVPKTKCAPGFLNLAQTFCIFSCSSENAVSGDSQNCVSCASKDPLSHFSQEKCVCVPGASKLLPFSSCACGKNFSSVAGSCLCSDKLSSDGTICSDRCPAAEVSIQGYARCSSCGSKVSNVDQTACVDKTACAPGFLNLAGTFCIANCAFEKSGANALNQCKPCETINSLSFFNDTGCSCLPRATGSITQCVCNTAAGFAGPRCSCYAKTSSSGASCGNQCPYDEVHLPGASRCSKCSLGFVPNVDQDGCVSKTYCAPGFLNLAQTFCIFSCSSENAGSNSKNQCTPCVLLDPLSLFSASGCVCVPGASGSIPSCACRQGFSTAGNACKCSKKISSDWATCSENCPSTEVFLNGASTCSTCPGKVPNAGQTACVHKTACAPGFLNRAQTHCVFDCAQDSATSGSDYQCVLCSSINALSVFGSRSCVCARNAVGSGTSCTCNTANGFSGVGCSCFKKLSADGSTCQDSCPSTEVHLPGASRCSHCPQNTVPNVGQDGCVPKTKCAPGFLNLAQTFCIFSCSSENAVSGDSQNCVSCASKDPLSHFSQEKCVCVPGASKLLPFSSCACGKNFSSVAGSCLCSDKLSSDGTICSDRCPAAEVSIQGYARCSSCGSKVSNVDQTACVDKTACAPGFLNLAGTFCIANCAFEKSGANALNQCKPCETINSLSFFNDT